MNRGQENLKKGKYMLRNGKCKSTHRCKNKQHKRHRTMSTSHYDSQVESLVPRQAVPEPSPLAEIRPINQQCQQSEESRHCHEDPGDSKKYWRKPGERHIRSTPPVRLFPTMSRIIGFFPNFDVTMRMICAILEPNGRYKFIHTS
jgi:hypothetical protein